MMKTRRGSSPGASSNPYRRLEVLILLLRDSSFLRNLTLGKTVNNTPLV